MRELRSNYQYGSAALVPEESYEEQAQRRQRKEERRRKLHEQNARRRAHQRALRAAGLRSFFVTIAVTFFGIMLFASVYLQNQVSATKKNISSLEDQISEVNMLNSAAKSRIDTSVNINAIRVKAQQDMGMVHAGSDHIVYYELGDTDFMVKY